MNTATKRPRATRINVRGMFRLQLVEDASGRVCGDSGWRKNNVVNLGLQNLCYLLSASAGSTTVSRVLLGTGTAPGDTDTTLNGELPVTTVAGTNTSTNRVAVVVSQIGTNAGTAAVEFQFTYASSASHITAAVTLSNVGLINSVTTGGTIFAGNTFSSSQWQTNQSVQGSYRITFAG